MYSQGKKKKKKSSWISGCLKKNWKDQCEFYVVHLHFTVAMDFEKRGDQTLYEKVFMR